MSESTTAHEVNGLPTATELKATVANSVGTPKQGLLAQANRDELSTVNHLLLNSNATATTLASNAHSSSTPLGCGHDTSSEHGSAESTQNSKDDESLANTLMPDQEDTNNPTYQHHGIINETANKSNRPSCTELCSISISTPARMHTHTPGQTMGPSQVDFVLKLGFLFGLLTMTYVGIVTLLNALRSIDNGTSD